MRILIHDFCGHAFPAELSRWLACEGHEVLQLYTPDVEVPRGRLEPGPGDPGSLTIEAIRLENKIAKYRPLKRLRQERSYAARVAARLVEWKPDAVLSGNCAPEIQRILQRAARRADARFVYWLQDIYHFAIDRFLRARIGPFAAPLAALARHRELQAIRASDAVVAISPDFRDLLVRHRVSASRIHVIENWAPLTEIAFPGDGAGWRREQGLEGRFVFLYAGTLGLKHDPELLAALARHFRCDPEVAIVVVSQGRGRRELEARKAAERLDNLVLLDYQPARRLSELHAAADVAVAILEPYAGVLSVPSKVLTYLATGRPVLAAIPESNLAARRIREIGAGRVVPPEDADAFVAAAEALRADPSEREREAGRARVYAERAFDLDRIGRAFLAVLSSAR